MAEWIDLRNEEIDPQAVKSVPAAVALECMVFPIRFIDETLMVAIADPDDCGDISDKLRFILNREVELVGASPIDLKFAIWRHYGSF